MTVWVTCLMATGAVRAMTTESSAVETARLIEDTQRWCGWAYIDRDGEMYPCDRKSWRRLVDGPELWEGAFCKYHASRALKRAHAEQRADAEYMDR